MPDTFDLDGQPAGPGPGNPRPTPPGMGRPMTPPGTVPPLAGQLPTTRASEVFKTPSKPGGIGGDPNASGPQIDRPATKFDDLASGVFTISSLVFLAGLLYLLWGTWGGSFADPSFTTVFDHDQRLRVMSNIGLFGEIMWVALIVATATFLFLFFHEDYAGYSMLGVAIVLMIGIPYGTQFIFNYQSHAVTKATNDIAAILASQAWFVGIPGAVLSVFSIAKSAVNGLTAAKSRRSTLKFGQQAVKDVKPKNQFLGACWNLPYCKEGIRSKCPIFLGKKGPCWRNKRGCMCDQTILLIAQAPNWKQSVNSTIGKIEGRSAAVSMPELPPQPQMSKAAKDERCRQCVIYNLHQEQKYKLMVGIVLGGTAAVIFVFNSELLGITQAAFNWANNLTGKLSITANTNPLFDHGAPQFVLWLILASLSLVAISKLLQLVEYFCFKLKI